MFQHRIDPGMSRSAERTPLIHWFGSGGDEKLPGRFRRQWRSLVETPRDCTVAEDPQVEAREVEGVAPVVNRIEIEASRKRRDSAAAP
jgi:hypothetical protein